MKIWGLYLEILPLENIGRDTATDIDEYPVAKIHSIIVQLLGSGTGDENEVVFLSPVPNMHKPMVDIESHHSSPITTLASRSYSCSCRNNSV